ncbi:hypothetical protein OS189_11185 [Sulfitobacter sp. F26169L]|uniref:hypothetical protein n=1 Tax=Sulfitobacter sp. F26169L TaxID=2996015 RepID=UPI0022608757|nr:hypothetical protein [Sulfitobacter sp. F26169L]MCX7566903.1 hypothetical protein [Sulfitobacter sp. F26169L]
MRIAPLLCALFLAAPVGAQTFDVSLGGKTLGQLDFSGNGRTSTLRSTLDNTPLGVFNGTFSGTSTGSDQNSTFTGDSRSSRKQRIVQVEIAKGRAVSTDITPPEEQTDLSNVARVPAGVLDPVRAIGRLISAKGCPKSMRLYDGRRVVTLGVGAGNQTENLLVCPVSYRVTAGPGHLSPLRISSAKMQLTYVVSGSTQNLHQIRISSGPFSLSLDRR